MYLISPENKQYKANLHCHSVLSDGKLSPKELKKIYKERGYSLLAITDHEAPKNHSYLNDDDFITITGYEAYIRKNPECKYDSYIEEIHINLFAKSPDNEAIVCYNPNYCKYVPRELHDKYQKVGSQRDREYSVKYINEFVNTANENGYIAAFNHPWWSMGSEDNIFKYEGFFSVEMCNYGCYLSSRLEYNAALYDKLLKNGKKLYCHSADDNHNVAELDSPYSDSFGAFTMIMPKSFTYDAVLEAMQAGEMYSSMGPVFKEISIEENKIHIECSDVERIMVFTGSKEPYCKLAERGGQISRADFEIDSRAEFVRVSVMDKEGRFADTRGFFRSELYF